MLPGVGPQLHLVLALHLAFAFARNRSVVEGAVSLVLRVIEGNVAQQGSVILALAALATEVGPGRSPDRRQPTLLDEWVGYG